MKDRFLRSHVSRGPDHICGVVMKCTKMRVFSQMDHEGWVKVEIISSFNRIKSLSTDLNLIRDVMSLSAFLEVDVERNVVRKRGDWAEWVLPMSAIPPYPSTGNPTSATQSRDTPPHGPVYGSVQFSSPSTTNNSSVQPTLASEKSDHCDSTGASSNGQPASSDAEESSSSSLGCKDGSEGIVGVGNELEPLAEEGDEVIKDLTKSFDPVITGQMRLFLLLGCCGLSCFPTHSVVSPKGGQRTISIGFDPSVTRPRHAKQAVRKRSTVR